MRLWNSHSVWDLMSFKRESLRRRISIRKLPSPQAGSRKRLSSRKDSSRTRSSMAFTSRGLVNTSPWSATLWRLLICFVFSFVVGIKKSVNFCRVRRLWTAFSPKRESPRIYRERSAFSLGKRKLSRFPYSLKSKIAFILYV